MTDLLGPGAEAPSKRGSTEESTERSIDVIGWVIYLSWRTVAIARHNRLKALSLFTERLVPVVVRVAVCEALASLAERYSTVY